MIPILHPKCMELIHFPLQRFLKEKRIMMLNDINSDFPISSSELITLKVDDASNRKVL